jgi:hypothetical protein
MPEGTLIPPRDPHAWDAEELIASVIPFRQRGAQPEEPIADDREGDVAFVAAPADEPASNWIAEGSHLLAHDAIPQTLSEDAAKGLSRLGCGERGEVRFLERDQAARELQQREMVVVFL